MNQHSPSAEVINYLFVNSSPELTWDKAIAVIKRIHPAYDAALIRRVFDDTVNLFQGNYPGYAAIKTPYHDLPHTLDVLICAVRLMHGLHLSGEPITDDEITQIVTATLMHDVGYVQVRGEERGTGAQYTKNHIQRGLEFMHQFLARLGLPAHFAARLEPIIHCSDPTLPVDKIAFPDERTRLLGQIVGTADLVGQMADRAYLEKLPFLYEEFKEGQIGNYRNMYDLMRQTHNFYAAIQKKLDNDFGGLYAKLSHHFKDTLGVDNNYYMESIQKNMAYLATVTSHDEPEYQAKVTRGEIMRRTQR